MIMFHVNLQGCRWHLVITLVDFWKVTSTLKCSEFFHIWWQLEACDISDLWLLEARFQQQLLCFLSRVHMGKTYKAAVFYNVFFCLGQSHEKGIPKSCPFSFGTFANKDIKGSSQKSIAQQINGWKWNWIHYDGGQIWGYPNKSSPRNGKQWSLRAKLKQRAKQPAFHVMECSIFRVTLFGV